MLIATGMLSGCVPAPEPTPTPTAAFASEEEAFAAAESTYRAYIDALNSIDPSDPSTFEPVFELSTGAFEADDRKSLSAMHAEGQHITGDSYVVSFRGDHAQPPFEKVQAVACLDVHEVEITDSEGTSLVNPNRPDVYALQVSLALTDGILRITAAERVEDMECVDR